MSSYDNLIEAHLSKKSPKKYKSSTSESRNLVTVSCYCIVSPPNSASNEATLVTSVTRLTHVTIAFSFVLFSTYVSIFLPLFNTSSLPFQCEVVAIYIRVNTQDSYYLVNELKYRRLLVFLKSVFIVAIYRLTI